MGSTSGPGIYRFRVRAPGGQEIVSEVIRVAPLQPLVSTLAPGVERAEATQPEDPAVQAHHLPEAAVLQALQDGTHQQALKTHFGEAYEDLRDAVKSVAARASGKKRRRVFLLPGVMASLIGEPQGSSNHVKWLDPLEVAEGNLFALSYDHQPILGTSVAPLLPCYLPLKLRLQLADHDVDIIHYDWRHPLSELGRMLAEKINADKAPKVTLVCHSMGGLVARAALKADAGASAKVDLVVQLGTPNLGAPTMAQAIRGSYPTVQTLATMDLKHDADDYGKLVATFPGVYELMPPSGSPFGLDLRARSSWPKDGNQPNDQYLTQCGKTQDGLARPDGRFFLVAGANLDTVTNVRQQGGELLYEYTLAGDGTVPVVSAQMPGLDQAWFDDGVAHDKLCMVPSTCDAAASILDGNAPKLPTTFKAKKDGITKTETDASLKESKLAKLAGKIEGDAAHVFDTVHSAVSKAAGLVHEDIHSGLKKAGSWLKKHF